MIRKTKIVCTIGPASSDKTMLMKLIKAGMNVARLNFSHGTHETHAEKYYLIRELANKAGKYIGIMADTKGPEIRTGCFTGGGVNFQAKAKVVIASGAGLGDQEKFYINCPELFTDIHEGDYILIDDGKMRFDVLEKRPDLSLVCKVMNSGYLSDHKSCNVPHRHISIPFMSEKDRADLEFAVKLGVDIIAASFVRCPSDVLEIRKITEAWGRPHVQIVAKIENQQGVNNLNEILKVADGIMVARGDLGVEVSMQMVPIYQKKIIKKANEMGKPVITATHMLESMINNPRPTRAEASDVANAIIDGSDAIMLSGETAVGLWPIAAVKTMDTIAKEIEKIIPHEENLQKSIQSSQRTVNDAIGIAVAQSAITLPSADAIVAYTETGGTAKRMAKFRPAVPIFAITDSIDSACQLAYYYGVYATIEPEVDNFAKYDELAIRVGKKFGLKAGSTLIITSGLGEKHGRTNTLRIIDITGEDE